MTDVQTDVRAENRSAPGAPELTPEAIAFAHRMFDAARHGDGVLLQAVDAGLPVDMTNDEGNTLLMLAAYNGHVELVKGLIERGADVDRANDRGQAPLAGAVFKGFDALARLLVAAGADPHAGTPSAVQTARMFGQDALLALMTARAGAGQEGGAPEGGA
ncbi:ankyrin repeat domain-containing protein [Phanerochaete sordida]|uniref:Ankyrin repeat domain-containing protein n=1 Tax=Phanerochaete sordida TaxID=48140 RepID=A0A9P3G9X4_9APHY|nr:ankyrin repeat domain-containing protein [Phanerochaete sordida]